MSKKLAILVGLALLALSLSVAVLQVRSYWFADSITWKYGGGFRVFSSIRGTLGTRFEEVDDMSRLKMDWFYSLRLPGIMNAENVFVEPIGSGDPLLPQPTWRACGLEYFADDRCLLFPHWMLSAFAGIPAVAIIFHPLRRIGKSKIAKLS